MTDLAEQIHRDRERHSDFLRRRDEIRARLDAGIESGRAEESDHDLGNIDRNGDLLEVPRFMLTGWRTNDETEDGDRITAATAHGAGRRLEEMLLGGYRQIIVGDRTWEGGTP